MRGQKHDTLLWLIWGKAISLRQAYMFWLQTVVPLWLIGLFASM